jgi:hypothetical protein
MRSIAAKVLISDAVAVKHITMCSVLCSARMAENVSVVIFYSLIIAVV